MRWLSEKDFTLSIAGRTVWDEDEGRASHRLWTTFQRDWPKPQSTQSGRPRVVPEMDEMVDVPEITTDCWSVLGISPGSHDVRVISNGG